jgi:hypothetical protein
MGTPIKISAGVIVTMEPSRILAISTLRSLIVL